MTTPNINRNVFPPNVQPPSFGVGANMGGVSVTYTPPPHNQSFRGTVGPHMVGGQYRNNNTTFNGAISRNGYIQGGIHQRTDCTIQ